jgi:hypothetical protein
MLFAHFFKARGKGNFELIISTHAGLQGVIATHPVAGKREARALALSLNAKPWNF